MKFHKSPIAKGLVCTAAGSLFLIQASGFSLSSVEAQQKTSIQQELEKLYQQEGRQAPSMELKTLPRDTIDGRVFQESADPGQPPQSVSPQQRQSQPPVRQAVPAAQASAAYDARDRQNSVQPSLEQTVESPAPKKRGLLNRMNGFDKLMFWKKNKNKNTELSEDAVAETPVTSEPEARQSPAYQPPAAPPVAPPAEYPTTRFQRPVQNRPTVSQPKALPIVETPIVETPVVEEVVPVKEPIKTVSEQPTPTPAAKLPSLDELPKEPVPIIPEVKPEPAPEPPPMVDEFFPDPFTEMSEDKADLSKDDMEIPDIRMDMNETPALQPIPETPEDAAPALPEVKENKTPAPQPVPVNESPAANPDNQLLEDENPFSGLKLEEPAATLPMGDADQGSQTAPSLPIDAVPALPMETEQAPSGAPVLPDLNPAFEDEFKLPVKKETSEEPIPELPVLEKIPEAIPELPGVEQGDISWEEEEARRTSKLDLIADREGETGLKGFCIVALRDNRDLIDALPSFRSTYNLRTYHFSSLAMKIEFDKEPRKYVPAYDGNDPILLSTQSEEREGSLDYALWFKGRLYLFTTHENLEIFQLDPVLYAEK